MSISLINKPVLLLNQNYEPMQICTARRAFVLLFQGKAEMIEKADGLKIHTVTKAFNLPSVVRLWHYKKIPQKKVMLTRKNIFSRDSNQCQYCGTQDNLTLDHVVPKAKGGKSTWSNLITACKGCNTHKGDCLPEEIGLEIMNKPFKPSYIIFLREYSGYAHDEWHPYLRTGTGG